MKRYTVNCHYDMVISVDVIAEDETKALEMAYNQAAQLPADAMECVGHNECVTACEEVTAEELRRKEREAVQEHVRNYIGWLAEDEHMKEDLADIAYRGFMINWPHGALSIPEGHPLAKWLEELFNTLAEGEHPNQELYDRYAAMYARREFERRYKRFGKSAFAADGLEHLSRLQIKQAWKDGLRTLKELAPAVGCGHDAQMVVRYYPDFDERDEYVNLFIYYLGDHYETAWQWICERDGEYDDKDYLSEDWQTEEGMFAHFFYTGCDLLGDCNTISAIWVDA